MKMYLFSQKFKLKNIFHISNWILYFKYNIKYENLENCQIINIGTSYYVV